MATKKSKKLLSCNPKEVMGYYDGNTVTALWNYAQHFAMSDNFFQSTFGPTLLGHINLNSGQTHGATPNNIKDHVVNSTVIANIDPTYDDCSNSTNNIAMSGKNIGNLLNAKNITWGWFATGFKTIHYTIIRYCVYSRCVLHISAGCR